ncbi:phosphonate C-P lyase system protein PhnH [Nocardia africana]|uniref:Phosphonate C-P lyase system protein PhnH n=1 Tax=Nocardia africana TaxID=134964 RepID=A0ABW6NRR6_9NOCA
MTRPLDSGHDLVGIGSEHSGEIFRALLMAAAQPGQLLRLPATVPAGSGPAVVLAALAHRDAGIAVHPGSDPHARELIEQIIDHTGARLSSLDNADFAAVFPGLDEPTVRRLRVGTASDPALGAQIFVGCRSLRSVDASSSIDVDVCLNLSGPGVDGHRLIGVTGLDPAGVARRNAACAEFPEGFDLWLVDNDGLICGLPRSTRIELVAEGAI